MPGEFVKLFQERRLDEILNDLPKLINEKWLQDYIFVTMLTSDDVIIANPGLQHIFIAEPDFTFTVVPFWYRQSLRFERGYKFLDDSNELYADAYKSSVEAGNSILFEHTEVGDLKITTTFPSTSFYIYRGEQKVPALIFNRNDIPVHGDAISYTETKRI